MMGTENLVFTRSKKIVTIQLRDNELLCTFVSSCFSTDFGIYLFFRLHLKIENNVKPTVIWNVFLCE